MDNKELKDYLLKNPIDRSKPNAYSDVAKKLNMHSEAIRAAWRRLRRQGLVEQCVDVCTDTKYNDYKSSDDAKYEYKEERRGDGSVQIQDTVDRRLTDDELFERYGRNREEWKIISIWFKDKTNGFLLSVHFAPIKHVIELNNQKELILEEIKKHSQPSKKDKEIIFPKDFFEAIGKNADIPVIHSLNEFFDDQYPSKDRFLYEIAIPDIHIGKLSWSKEVGEDYDISIAIKRYTDAVDALLSRVVMGNIDKFLLPIGNDLLNVDNNSNTTTAGTPQSSDSRFGKMFLAAKKLLIETIDKLEKLAPVDVVVVAGNHDNLNMFTLGEVLSAWYHNNSRVKVDNSPKARKYYQYGNTGIQFTHGNQEKHLELGLIFATEEPKLWADTQFRFCQLGHFHHTKKTQYVSVQEHQGFQVQILPSLSGTDNWHYGKGYNSLKQAKGFLINKSDGIVGEFTHTVK